MNDFINHYPYSDLHELNLDWIIETVKKLDVKMDEFEAINKIKFADPIEWNITTQYAPFTIVTDLETNSTYLSVKAVPAGIEITNDEFWYMVGTFIIDYTLDADSDNPIANRTVTAKFNEVDSDISDINSDISGITPRIDTLEEQVSDIESDISAEAEARITEDDLINTRIDNIIALPDGSTTADAELIDIRTTWDDLSLASAGDAVREQSQFISNALSVFEETKNIRFLANIRGKYIGTDGSTLNTSNAYRVSDYVEIPEGSISVRFGNSFYLNSTKYYMANGVCFYDADKTFIRYSRSSNLDYVTGKIPLNAKYIRFNQPNRQLSTLNTIKDGLWFISDPAAAAVGLVDTYTGAFTAANQTLNTGIDLKANTTYLIRFFSNRTASVNIFIGNDTANYKTVKEYDYEVWFSHTNTDTNLKLYNIGGGIDPIVMYVYEADSVKAAADTVPKHYSVGKSATAFDYTSLTACLLALKDDISPKVIDIYEGEYDLYQEYIDADVPVYTGENPETDFINYCVFVPSNTHIIGHGIVKLNWMPNKTDNPEITWMQCFCVSNLNIMGSCIIENVELHQKNGRYCIHNDTIGIPPYAYVEQKFINVKCYKYIGEEDSTTTPGETHIFGTRHTTGFGQGRGIKQEYINCEFHNDWNGRAFYGHSNNNYKDVIITKDQSGEIILDGCIIDSASTTSVKLGNTGTYQRNIRTKIKDCYISGLVLVEDEAGGGTKPNNFNLTFLDSGTVRLHISYAGNIYTPKAYRTDLNIS